MDDTSAVVSAPTTQQLAIKIQATSESIEQYLDDNLLKVNTEKSKLLVNAPRNQDKSIIAVKTSDKPILPQKTLKLLGVHISDDPSWNHQVSELMKQLNYRVFTLSLVSHYCSITLKKNCQGSISK